jgi:hypothetical protein
MSSSHSLVIAKNSIALTATRHSHSNVVTEWRYSWSFAANLLSFARFKRESGIQVPRILSSGNDRYTRVTRQLTGKVLCCTVRWIDAQVKVR